MLSFAGVLVGAVSVATLSVAVLPLAIEGAKQIVDAKKESSESTERRHKEFIQKLLNSMKAKFIIP